MAKAVGFAPGHLTGLFVPDISSGDVLRRGSTGGGIVLERGARAQVEAAPAIRNRLRILVDGKTARLPVTRLSVERVLEGLPASWDVRVDLTHELPVSQGFGMSAAGALSAALAVARLTGGTRESAIFAAHTAEIERHGGLGGVAAILGGGLEVRRSAGVPPYGSVERTPASGTIIVAFHASQGMPSPPLLSDPTFLRKVRAAGKDLIQDLSSPPLALAQLMESSLEFTTALGLASPSLRNAMEVCRKRGIHAAQAMLGHTLFTAGKPAMSEQLLRDLGFATLRLMIGQHGPTVKMVDPKSPPRAN